MDILNFCGNILSVLIESVKSLNLFCCFKYQLINKIEVLELLESLFQAMYPGIESHIRIIYAIDKVKKSISSNLFDVPSPKKCFLKRCLPVFVCTAQSRELDQIRHVEIFLPHLGTLFLFILFFYNYKFEGS